MDLAREPDSLHRALLTGLLSKVGRWNAENRSYTGAKQTRFAVHPSSALAKKPPAWIMAFELVETSQLFARTAAKIEPEWLLDAGAHLLKRSYSDPHWSEKSARASIKEHATLFGLSVARDRSVDYATIAPAEARRMFLDHALVRGEYKTRGEFQQVNGELLLEVARLRDRARRSDMLADDDALLAFFDRRVPADVVNGKTFEAWREHAERDDPTVLHLGLDDVLGLSGDSDERLTSSDFPETVTLHGASLPLAYLFDPSADDDGITITVPLVLLPQLDPGELDWTIPGWHREKIAALLHGLPKAHRRELGDIPELASALASRLTPFEGPMIPALARAVAEELGVDVPEETFRPDAVTAHLRLTCRIIDEQGKVVAQTRDVDAIFAQYGARARAVWKRVASASPAASTWERTGITTWDFDELPRFVARAIANMEVRSYPAIVDRGASVDLALLESEGAADEATRGGVRRLLTLATRAAISTVAPRLPAPFSRPSGALPSRADGDAFRAMLLARIVDLASGLGDGDDGDGALPRTRTAFDALVRAAAPRIAAAFNVFASAIKPVATELDKTLLALRNASKHPSGRAAIVDMYAQLEHLFPTDLIAWVPVARLGHYPRYLRAVQARLQRAVSDPRKDADKLAPLAPVWATFLAKRATARDPAAARELRWMLEELRVAIFAPELKTPLPVSTAKVASAVAALRA